MRILKKLTVLFSWTMLVACGSGDDDMSPNSQDPDEDDETIDAIAPQVNSVSPTNGSTGVDINSNIVITFSEGVDVNTIKTGTLILGASSAPNIAWNFNLSGNTGTVVPTDPLQYGLTYTLRLTTAVTDLAGNNLESDFETSFTTEEEPDKTAPEIVSVTPSNNATAVSLETEIIIKFSEPVENIGFETFKIRKTGETGSIDGTGVMSFDRFIYTPKSPLAPSTEYSILIETGITDVAGINLKERSETTFTTESVILTITEKPPSSQVEVSGSLSIVFSANIDAGTVDENSFNFRDFSTDQKVIGNTEVSGNAIIFTPTTDLKEYQQQYYFTITTDIKDVNGNGLEKDEFPMITTVYVSELYYYRLQDRDTGKRLIYSIGNDKIELSNPVVNSEELWSFTKITNNNGTRHSISNRAAGSDKYIEGTAPDDGNSIILTGRPSSSNWFGGQIFSVGNIGNISGIEIIWLKNNDQTRILDAAILDMTATIDNTASQYWEVYRDVKK